MTELKREYVIPLRRKTRTAPKWRRSKKAVSVLKDFIKKNMKTDNVVICNELNETIWNRGIKNPPGKVSVIALKTEIAGEEKTLVNLANVGINAQLEKYMKAQAEENKSTQESSESDEQKQDIKEAEVKEKETKTYDSTKDEKETTDSENKNTNNKESEKKEVEKNE